MKEFFKGHFGEQENVWKGNKDVVKSYQRKVKNNLKSGFLAQETKSMNNLLKEKLLLGLLT